MAPAPGRVPDVEAPAPVAAAAAVAVAVAGMLQAAAPMAADAEDAEDVAVVGEKLELHLEDGNPWWLPTRVCRVYAYGNP